MKEILGDLERWRASGHRVALARVVDVDGSGPRLPGAAMAVSEVGEVAGSISGGCVEGATVAEALTLLDRGGPGALVTFGYSDDDAFAVGLTCGGTLHVFLEELDRPDLVAQLATELRADRPVALATVVDGRGVGRKLLLRPGAGPEGSLGSEDLDRVVARDAVAELEAGRSGLRHYGPDGEARQDEVTVFIESFARQPRMVIFGAVDFTGALVKIAKVLGYHVTVCDAREVFATSRRFPLADEVVVDWPHRFLARAGPDLTVRDAVIVLTHDHKFDVPAVIAALDTGAGYLGAMGSRRTTEDRRKRLLASGLTESALDRLHAPIGLDIGARTPEETAVSICAEIVAARTGRPTQPLRSGEGPIHAIR